MYSIRRRTVSSVYYPLIPFHRSQDAARLSLLRISNELRGVGQGPKLPKEPKGFDVDFHFLFARQPGSPATEALRRLLRISGVSSPSSSPSPSSDGNQHRPQLVLFQRATLRRYEIYTNSDEHDVSEAAIRRLLDDFRGSRQGLRCVDVEKD